MIEHKLVLWGHSLQDYQEMLALDQADLAKRIVDCGAGAASFNADMQQLGHTVISCDDIYNKSPEEMTDYIHQQFSTMLQQMRDHQDQFVWQNVSSFDDLVKRRRAGIERFLDDYALGKQQQRYQATSISAMPFKHFEFDLAVCSYYLYSLHDDQDADFHINATMEMCRIAKEVHIFPLIDSAGEISPLVGPVMLALQQNNYGVEIREVPFRLQKQGNAMMRVWALQCEMQ